MAEQKSIEYQNLFQEERWASVQAFTNGQNDNTHFNTAAGKEVSRLVFRIENI